MDLRFVQSKRRLATVAALAIAVFAVTIQFVPNAEAGGPAYSGPQTQLNAGPAYFGPAPNPIPYCQNPTYFDPFPENGTIDAANNIVVQPVGSIDVTGAPNASVTTDGITMDFELTSEGAPGTQYPGFFPGVGPGGAMIGNLSDQPKGVEMAGLDVATVTLSQPLFYSQWVFTDVDRANEGFDVTPAWTDPANPGAVLLVAGDPTLSPVDEFDFTGTSQTVASFNDALPAPGHDSGSIRGRVQVDFIGAVTGISMARKDGSGQSGFAVGGGCIPLGVAKEVTAGPTWNGQNYTVEYTIHIRNNLPSTATLSADVAAAGAASNNTFQTGAIEGIGLENVQLTDVLSDGNGAFSSVDLVSLVSSSGNLATNPNYDGIDDTNLLAAGQSIPAETEESFVVTVDYTPDLNGALGASCQSSLQITNSAAVSGSAAGVDVIDQSDNGNDPDPGVDNGDGGVDDPSPVEFQCPPADIQIVKTVVDGPNGTCPAFADGIVGDGDALTVTAGDTVTYCISVINPGVTAANSVLVTDPMAPAGWDGTIGTLAGGAEARVWFDLVVDEQTETLNTAQATGVGPNGDLGPVTDTALIAVSPLPVPGVGISKTVLSGAAANCATAVEGTDEYLVGEPGDAATWCITVTNTGETALSPVIVNDAVLAITDLDVLATHGGGASALLVSESITFAFEGTIPDANLVNTVGVVATPSTDDGTPLDGFTDVVDENDAEVDAAALDLQKTVVAGAGGDCAAGGEEVIVERGSTVTYCFTVANTGSVTLDVIDIADATLGVRVPLPAASQQIAPGETVTVSIEVEAQDITNTATVTGTPVDPDGIAIPGAPEPTDEDTATVDILANPGVSLSKTVLRAGSDCADAVEGEHEFLVTEPGDAVLWCFTVTNTGDVPLVNVLLDDELLGLTNYDVLAENDGGDALDVDGSLTFAIAGTVPAEGALNTATVLAQGADENGDPLPDLDPVADTNTAEVGSTDLELVKAVVAGAAGDCVTAVDEVTVPDGTPVTYCFTVTNTGSVDLQVTEVNDTTLGITVPVPAAARIIAPGASISVSIEVPASALTNTADVVGTPLLSGDPIPGSPQPTDDDTAVVRTQTPMLDVVKTVVAGPAGDCPATVADGVAGPGAPLTVSINDTVTYCMNVANTGEVDIDNVIVTDPMAPVTFDGAIGTLAAGAETVVSFDVLVLSTTELTNTASVTGDNPAGGELPPDEDTAIIERPVPAPSVSISKTVVARGESCATAVEGEDESLKGQIGDEVTWCVTVTNDGNVPLANIIVNDELIGITDLDVLAVHGGGASALLVGESISFSFDGVVPEDGMVNTVTVGATPSDPDGTPIAGVPDTTDSNDASVDPKQADIKVSKTVDDPGPVVRGTELTYTVTVTNDGPDEAVDVSVTDVLPAGLRLDTLPDVDGWACSRNDDGWTCELDGPFAADESVSLVYKVTTAQDAPLNTKLVNTATASSSTPDPNPDDNGDTTTTEVHNPPLITPQAPPVPAPAPPDQVLAQPPVTPPLAYTGSNAIALSALGAFLVLGGGVFVIAGARRRSDATDRRDDG